MKTIPQDVVARLEHEWAQMRPVLPRSAPMAANDAAPNVRKSEAMAPAVATAAAG